MAVCECVYVYILSDSKKMMLKSSSRTEYVSTVDCMVDCKVEYKEEYKVDYKVEEWITWTYEME